MLTNYFQSSVVSQVLYGLTCTDILFTYCQRLQTKLYLATKLGESSDYLAKDPPLTHLTWNLFRFMRWLMAAFKDSFKLVMLGNELRLILYLLNQLILY